MTDEKAFKNFDLSKEWAEIEPELDAVHEKLHAAGIPAHFTVCTKVDDEGEECISYASCTGRSRNVIMQKLVGKSSEAVSGLISSACAMVDYLGDIKNEEGESMLNVILARRASGPIKEVIEAIDAEIKRRESLQ